MFKRVTCSLHALASHPADDSTCGGFCTRVCCLSCPIPAVLPPKTQPVTTNSFPLKKPPVNNFSRSITQFNTWHGLLALRNALVQWGGWGTIWLTQADGVSDLTGCNSALLLLLALISTARSFLTTVITCTTEDRVNSHGLNTFHQSCTPQHDFAAHCSSTAGVMLRSGHKQGHSNTLHNRHSTMKTAFELLLSWMARMTVTLTATGIC